MTTDLYSGQINWDRIYRTFHDPVRIAKRVEEELGGTNNLVVFSGFQETASHLANKMPVTFVDYSATITDRAKQQHPGLYEVRTGDVTKLISHIPASNIVIACRISAYWDSHEFFEQLAASLLCFPRNRVLIDFFDRDLIKPGQHINFESDEGVGDWAFLDIEESNGKEPLFFKVKLKVTYSFSDHGFSYEGYRSFFRKEDVLRWSHSNFPNYDATVAESLMDHDPSFSLKLVRNYEG